MSDPLLTLVAADIRTGALLLDITDTELDLTRYYVFLDDQGNPIPLLADQESGHVIPLPQIPPNVRQALHLIDVWTRSLVLNTFH